MGWLRGRVIPVAEHDLNIKLKALADAMSLSMRNVTKAFEDIAMAFDSGARGLWQIMPSTAFRTEAQQYALYEQMMQPRTVLNSAADYAQFIFEHSAALFVVVLNPAPGNLRILVKDPSGPLHPADCLMLQRRMREFVPINTLVEVAGE